MDKRSLKKLEELAGRRAWKFGREWTNAGAVHQDEEHVIAVLRTLRDCGALGDVLKDDELEREALAMLDAAAL